MTFFPPFPRGTGNPCMKDISVRIDHNAESELFDRVNNMKIIPSNISSICQNIIELRDLQYFLKTCPASDQTEKFLEYVGEGMAYFLNLMDKNDAHMFASKVRCTLATDMNAQEVKNGMEILIKTIDGMCKVNAAIISMALRGELKRVKSEIRELSSISK